MIISDYDDFHNKISRFLQTLKIHMFLKAASSCNIYIVSCIYFLQNTNSYRVFQIFLWLNNVLKWYLLLIEKTQPSRTLFLSSLSRNLSLPKLTTTLTSQNLLRQKPFSILSRWTNHILIFYSVHIPLWYQL